jgi:Mor family transcriptional regulator
MNELIENLGYEVALKLCTVYGGCTLYVPNSKGLKLAERNQRIKSDRLAGAEINQLAINYQLSDRQIFSILK